MVRYGIVLKIAAVTIFLLSCSARDSTHVRVTMRTQEGDYSLRAEKSDKYKRFNMYLRNISSKSLCIRADEWPKNGIIDNCLARFSLSFSYLGKTVPYKNEMCLEGYSSTIVPPGASLEGYLNYADFEEDPQQIQDRIILNLPSGVFECDPTEFGPPHPLTQ
ncbi:hypothetical protein [Inquilinus sp. CA228]|uniref:hypothetical protein n=1 Tax=Inquilinus sp. CA228 TaxID=3455609 RepID=UPI003F8D4AB2